MLAHRRRVYHAHSWSATVRNLAVSVAQFNTKVLALRGVAMLTHEPQWYLQQGVQREAPSLEACATQWSAFATAWNSIVKALRTSDLLSTNEQDELLFVELRGKQVEQAFGVEVYVLFPAMLTSPVFSRRIWEQRTSSYPSVVRSLLQTRDLLWFLLLQLGLVRLADSEGKPNPKPNPNPNPTPNPKPNPTKGAPLPIEELRRRFLGTLTRLAELEAAERRSRLSSNQDASSLP